MKNQRSILYLILMMIAIGSFLFCVILYNFWPDWQWIYEPLHSTMEAVGSLAAIIMAILLFERKHETYNVKFFLLAIGFLGMGLLGGFHAVSSLEQGFVLLYSMANLVGGFGFALIWFPWFASDKDELWKKWFLWAIVLGSIFFGIWTLVARETLPMMVKNGKFTITAVSMNLLAGLFFLAGAGRLLLDFHRSQKKEFYLIACMATFLGMAGLMFKYSSIWGSSWWFWHLLRLIALLLMLKFLIYEYQRRTSDLRVALAERRQSEEELQESEKKYRDLVDNALAGVYKTNLKGDILYVNKALLSILEFETAEELMGNGALARYKNPKDREVLIKNLKKTGSITNFETILLTKNGRPKNILLSATLDGDTLSGMIMDITEPKRTEEVIRHQRDELSAHARILSAILQTTDLDEQLNLILNEVLAFLGVEFGSIHLMQGNEVVLRCWRGISDILRAQVLSFPVKEPPEWIQESFVVKERLSEQGQTPDFFKYEGIQAWTSVPLYLPPKEGKEREWLGVLIVCSRHYEALDENQVRALNNIADQLAMAIDNVRTYRQAQERMARLQALRDIDKAIMQRFDLKEVLHIVLERIPKELGADAAAISLLGEKQSKTEVFVMRLPNGTIIEEEAFTLADSLLHWFVNQQNPVIIYDLTQDPRVQMHRVYIRNGRLISYLGVPLIVKDRTIGILHILTTKPKVFADEDVGFFSTMAGQTAIAIENARSTEALRETRDYLDNLFNYANAPIIVWDSMFKITRFNHAFEHLTGYTTEEVIGQELSILFPKASRSESLEKIGHTLSGEYWESVEIPILHKDGEVRIALWNSANIIAEDGTTVIATIAQGQDITGRKQTEEALRSSEEKYRTILENIEDGYFEVDIAGNFTFFNDSMCQIYGYSREELMGMNDRQYTDQENAKKLFQAFNKVHRTGEPTKEFDWEIIRKDGTKRHIEASVSLMKDSSGNRIGFRGIVRDVTERERIEQEKSNLEEQLRQSQKMEAIGQLAGGIAHDFNNLLTVIKGYSQLTLNEIKQDDLLRENIEEVKTAADRAANLTRQLLAFSRRQAMEMKVIDLNTILQDLHKMLRRVIGEDIELVTVLAEDLGRVKTDPAQIEQVIMNLAVNGRDAMPDGGKLTIETANIELDEIYARNHIAVTPGRYVVLAVSDTGVGMTPEVRERVFEPFFTTKEKGKGTGLGLSTVYGIVKQSGGNIWVYSEPGKGTTFKIYLPRADEPLGELKKVEIKEIPHGSETILVVEDEEEVRKLTVAVLKKYGYTVLEAPQGLDAFLICEKYEGPIHLLVTDVIMPKLSGRELADRVATIRPEIKVLYMSGYTDNTISHHGILEEGIDYIQKPFTVEGMARKVREVLDK